MDSPTAAFDYNEVNSEGPKDPLKTEELYIYDCVNTDAVLCDSNADLICGQFVNEAQNYKNEIKLEDCSNDALYSDETVEIKQSWKCKVRNHKLNTKKAIKIHENYHRNERNYKCDSCGGNFASKVCLGRHICSSIDLPSKISYDSVVDSESHAVCIRSKTEIYHKCSVCKNSFNDLKIHKLVHLDEVINQVMYYAANSNISCKLCSEITEKLLPSVISEAEEIKRRNKNTLKASEYASFDNLVTRIEMHENEEDTRGCALYCNVFKKYGASDLCICDICNKKCVNKSDLSDHKLTHSLLKEQENENSMEEVGNIKDQKFLLKNEVKKSCDICNGIFNTTVELSLHKVTHNQDSRCRRSKDVGHRNKQNKTASEDKITCMVCVKQFSKKYMDVHMLLHSDKKAFHCEMCGERCVTKTRLQSHKLKHSEERNHVCDVCKKCYKAKYMLRRHILVHHSNERPFACNVCDKSFPTRCNLRLHQETHTDKRDFVCEVCNKAFKVKRNLTGHIREVHLNKLNPPKEKKISSYYLKKTECSICFKLFHVNYIDIHMKVHSEDKPFYCDICSRGYNSAKQLQLHKVTHSKDRVFICTYCGKSYKTKYVLYVHTMFNHSDDRPFPCEVCGKGFPTVGTRNTHQKIHAPTKDFVCDICNKAFSTKKMLRNHMKTHFFKDKQSAKPRNQQNQIYECNLCNKIYNLYGSLAYHKKSVHCTMNHKCEFCGKTFVYPVGLEKHLRIHTGEKSHLCEECGKSFNTYTSFITQKNPLKH